MGLMQLMPATWQHLALVMKLGGDPFDAHDNVLAGTAYLRQLYDRYGAPGFLAAYNAGPARYEASLRSGVPLPVETQKYVAAITKTMAVSGETTPPLPSLSPPIPWTQAELFADATPPEMVSPRARFGSRATPFVTLPPPPLEP